MRILVLDDRPLVARSLARTFRGCDAVHVTDPAEALILARSTHFDGLLVDLRMPAMHGRHFHEELHRTDPGVAAKVVFVTADPPDHDLPAPVVWKPMSPDQADRLVARWKRLG